MLITIICLCCTKFSQNVQNPYFTLNFKHPCHLYHYFLLFTVSVGYEYVDCPVVVWEIQTATMSGYDISSSEIGGWNLHLHHTYNYQEGEEMVNKPLVIYLYVLVTLCEYYLFQHKPI